MFVQNSDLVERFRFNYLLKMFRQSGEPVFDQGSTNGIFIPVSSSKAALCLALCDLHEKGKLASKNDNIFVPKNLSYSTYYVCQPYVFPVIEMTHSTKAILIFHQFGFPQNLSKILDFAKEKNLAVIEDCTQSFDRLGEFEFRKNNSDYAIFDFSNFFPCIMGGGLWVREKESANRITKMIEQNHSHIIQAASILLGLVLEIWPNVDRRYLFTRNGVSALHPRMNSSLRRLLLYFLSGPGIETRRNNWRNLRVALSGLDLVDDLEPGIAPYAIPVKVNLGKISSVMEGLSQLGLATPSVEFDLNRNMLFPNVQKRIVLPIHQGLDNTYVERVSQTLINRAI